MSNGKFMLWLDVHKKEMVMFFGALTFLSFMANQPMSVPAINEGRSMVRKASHDKFHNEFGGGVANSNHFHLPRSNVDGVVLEKKAKGGGGALQKLSLKDEISSRVRELNQFDPSTVTFYDHLNEDARGRNGVNLMLPEQPDPVPQSIIDSFVGRPPEDPNHFLANCEATSQFRVEIPPADKNFWILHTKGPTGIHKNYGGDELYVSYTDQTNLSENAPDAVARVVDLNDGRYAAYFLHSHNPRLSDVGRRGGVLSITVVHTCGASLLEPPLKAEWKETRDFLESGYIGTTYTTPVEVPPPVGELTDQPRRYPELNDYRILVPYGDSVTAGLYGLEEGHMRRPNLARTKKCAAPLNSDTLDENDRDTEHKKFLPNIWKHAEENHVVGGDDFDSALILGSCAWDISAHHTKASLGSEYHFFSFFDIEDHLDSIRRMIDAVRTRYPQRPILWQGCSAVHRQAAVARTAWGAWYSNNLRARHLDVAQKRLMAELQVPVIDMFELTYELADLYADHVHCTSECTVHLLDYIYPRKIEQQQPVAIMAQPVVTIDNQNVNIHNEPQQTEGNQPTDFNHKINVQVRRMTQFDPMTADFEPPKKPSNDFVVPEQPDTRPQEIIESVIDNPSNYLVGCVATAQYRFDTSQMPWVVNTIGADGTPKTYGGDELYITYKDETNGSISPNAVARVVDLANGRYELYFLKSRSFLLYDQPEMDGQGTLSILLVHTCGASMVEPPEKSRWIGDNENGESGYIGAKYEIGVSAPPIGELKEPFSGYPEFSEYDSIVPYGDSVMYGLFGLNEGEGLFSERRENVVKTHKCAAPLNSDTLDENDRDVKHEKYLPNIISYGESMNEKWGRDDNSAFILGSCAWDLTAHNNKASLGDGYHYYSFYDFPDHMKSVRTLIETIREKFPRWKIYWQSCSAMHRQAATSTTAWGTFYSNNIRGRNLWNAQKELMRELNVPVIDLFEMTYEMAEIYSDHVHCTPMGAFFLLHNIYPSPKHPFPFVKTKSQ